jgi:hypothetical protein
MTMIDPEEERHRLEESYSHQTDEELKAIASQGDELTDTALQALRAEMAKRGLTQDVLDGAPDASFTRDRVSRSGRRSQLLELAGS